jgi:hypothetical protein
MLNATGHFVRALEVNSKPIRFFMHEQNCQPPRKEEYGITH